MTAAVVLYILPMVSLDGTVIGAFFGFLGISVTALCGVYVATRTNRSEKESSAKKAIDESRDEVVEQRLALKDEQIANLREDLTNCRLEHRLDREEFEAELDKKNVIIDKQNAEIDALRRKL